MSLIFFLKPHYPRKLRAEMQFRAKSKKRRKRTYKILKTTTYPVAEEVNYFDEAQFSAYRAEERRILEGQRRDGEDLLLLAMMGAI